MARGPFFSNRPIGGGGKFFGIEPLETLQREMNRVFDEVWRNLPGGADDGGPRSFSVDITETLTQIRVRADLPGVAEPDVDLTLDDDRLTIRAERRGERRSDGETAHAAECYAGVFQRVVRLPTEVDPNHVDAHFERGVLTVTLDKPRAPDKGRKIPVRGPSHAGAASPSKSTGATTDSSLAGGATGGTPEAGSLTGGAGGSAEGAGGFGFIQGDGAVGPSPSTGAGAEPQTDTENAAKPGGAVHGYNE